MAKNFDSIVRSIPWHKSLSIHTNGILLHHKKDIILKHSPPFRTVTVAERKQRGQLYPKLIPNMILGYDSFRDLPRFIDLAATLDKEVEILLRYDAAMEGEDGERWQPEYETLLPRKHIHEVSVAMRAAMQLAAKKGVKIVFSGYGERACFEDTEDVEGSILAPKKVSECPMKTSATLHADGKGMLCVWQTRPIFNWRLEKTMDPLQTKRGREVVAMLERDIIPAECSGAPCAYIGRKPSKEKYVKIMGDFAGGWQQN